jgi:hypothetical protein
MAGVYWGSTEDEASFGEDRAAVETFHNRSSFLSMATKRPGEGQTGSGICKDHVAEETSGFKPSVFTMGAAYSPEASDGIDCAKGDRTMAQLLIDLYLYHMD